MWEEKQRENTTDTQDERKFISVYFYITNTFPLKIITKENNDQVDDDVDEENVVTMVEKFQQDSILF